MSGYQNPVDQDTDWMVDGACVGRDPELFYVEQLYGTRKNYEQKLAARSQIRRAKGICGSCPVKQLCLDHALDTKDEWMIMGGTTARERTKILKANKQANRGSKAA